MTGLKLKQKVCTATKQGYPEKNKKVELQQRSALRAINSGIAAFNQLGALFGCVCVYSVLFFVFFLPSLKVVN